MKPAVNAMTARIRRTSLSRDRPRSVFRSSSAGTVAEVGIGELLIHGGGRSRDFVGRHGNRFFGLLRRRIAWAYRSTFQNGFGPALTGLVGSKGLNSRKRFARGSSATSRVSSPHKWCRWRRRNLRSNLPTICRTSVTARFTTQSCEREHTQFRKCSNALLCMHLGRN